MAYQTLELTLISANDLKHATFISKKEVYAVSSIDGDPSSQQRTPADREGGTSPVWNTTLRFSIPPGDPSNHFLHVLLRCHRILGVRDIGEVRIPLKELLNCFAEGKGDRQFVSYQVRKNSSSKVGGVLNLSYKLLDVAPLKADEPVTAYPYAEPRMGATYPPAGGDVAPLRADEPVTAYPYAAEPRMGATYPPAGGAPPYAQRYPAPAGNGYPAPAPAGYGYPPVGYGYGATQPASARPARNNRLGMGMGTGLLGGAVGGLLIGDMLSDNHASDYNTVYDGGYDGGGFTDGGGYDDSGGGFDDGGGYDDGGDF